MTKFSVAVFMPVVATSVKVSQQIHPTVNMVLTNDESYDVNAAQLKESKNIRSELLNLIESEKHASFLEGNFNQPDVIRINYESPHASLMEGIVRESVDASTPYQEGEIGLNLIPASGSAASLDQIYNTFDAELFNAGIHKSFLESPAIRIRLPKGGFQEGAKLLSDDGRIAIRVLPAKHIPGGFSQLASMIEANGEKSEAAIGEILSLFAQGKMTKQQLKDSGAISRCAGVMKSEGASDAMRGGCGSVITHLTNTPVASSVMDANTGGAGHVTVVLPSPSRVYGA